MMRVLSLPADFFKSYSAGELSNRVSQVGVLCKMLASTVLSTGLTSLFSLLYLSQIFVYAPALVAPALIIILVTVVFSILSSLIQMKISIRQMELSGKEDGMTYALISGIQKIKLAGAENAPLHDGAIFMPKAQGLPTIRRCLSSSTPSSALP